MYAYRGTVQVNHWPTRTTLSAMGVQSDHALLLRYRSDDNNREIAPKLPAWLPSLNFRYAPQIPVGVHRTQTVIRAHKACMHHTLYAARKDEHCHKVI